MKNKNLHNSVSCFGLDSGLGDEGFGEKRLCPKKAAAPAGQEAPKPPDGTPVPTEQGKPQTPEEIEAAKKKKEEEVAQEAEQKKKELKTGVEAKQERAEFREAEGLPNVQPGGPGLPPLETTKPRTMESEEEKKPRKAPDVPPMSMKEFMKRDLRAEEIELVRWRINVTRENYQINWQNWDHSTASGIDKIYEDCQNLTIINTDKAFYDTMFAILKNSADKTVNKNLADKNYRNAFLHPLDRANHELIAGLPADGKFPGGEAFLRAYGHLLYLKSLLNLQDLAQKNTADKQRKATEDPIASRAADFFQDNFNTIKKAVREKDLSTLAMYGVGFYALWSTLGSKLFGGGGHGEGEHGGGTDFKKWFLIGAAAYCGNTLLKNAGYNVMKMVGFKDSDAELHGTPMEVLPNILQRSEYSEEFKDLDPSIVLSMGDTNLVTLENLRKQSNSDGIKFIHPREFPNLFPDLKNVYPFKMGQGEEALRDTTGMYNTKLSAKEKEYVRVGQQVYKLTLAMAETYNLTLHQHHKEFIGKTYDEALADSWLSQSKVRHLMDSVGEYAVKRENAWFSGKKPQEIEAKLNDFVKENAPGEAFAIHGPVDGAGEGAGDYKATFHGFPVVVSVAPTGLRVYLKNVYGKKYNTSPGPNYVAEIPLDGGAGAGLAISEAVKKINERMRELIQNSPILQDKNAILQSLKFVDGQWQCEVDDTAIPDLGIKGGKTTVVIEPDEDGISINGENLDRRSRFPLEILPRLVDQTNFHALSIFLSSGRLDAKYDKTKKNQFTVIIGKTKKIDIEIAYDGKTFKFVDPAKEAELFKKGSGFGDELSDALGEDERLNKVIAQWRNYIDNTSESYVINFFKSLPKWFTGATWSNVVKGIDLKDITGSVAKNYTIGLIEAQKALILAKMAGSIDGAKNLSDVDKLYGDIFVPAVESLGAMGAKFSEMNTQNEQAGRDWDADTFNTSVFGEIAKIGIKSNDYQGWYSQFTNEIFCRYGMDDLKEGDAVKARDVLKVFSYYTAVLDDPALDGADLSLKMTKETADYISRIKQAREALVAAGTANPNNQEIADEVNVGLPPGTILIDTDVARFLEIDKDFTKQQHHIAAAKYAQYVAGCIYAKFSDGELPAKVTVPAPEDRSFWNIRTFDEWQKTHPSIAHEFIDTRNRIKMNREYTTLDVYLKMTTAERASVDKKDIILPRYNCDFSLPLDANGAPTDTDGFYVAMELLGDVDAEGQIKKMKLTDAEKIFQDKFDQLLRKLQDKYPPGELVIQNIKNLKENYTISGSAPEDASVPGYITYKYTLDNVEYTDPNTNTVAVKDKDVIKEMKTMDGMFDTNDKTITRGMQMAYINNRLEEIFTNTVLSTEGLALYVDRDTLPEKIKRFFKDIKLWLLDDY